MLASLKDANPIENNWRQKQMIKNIVTMLFVFMLCITAVAAENYNIALSTIPEKVIARDNPFAHYEGKSPSVEVKVTDSQGMPAKDVTISLTITHVDNLILPTGFPWVEGKELLSITSLEPDGILTVDEILFPLRGEYQVDINVMDAQGTVQNQKTMLKAAEPFKQSTLNSVLFLGTLLVFGFIVGWIFSKGMSFGNKGQSKVTTMLVASLLLVSIVPLVLAHSEAEAEETGIVHYEDGQTLFYTNPEKPDIGTVTTFILEVKDEHGNPVNNAIAHIEFANEEEGFVVLTTSLFSQTGTFSWNYGIFDGAPHMAKISVEPTASSSVKFNKIEREYAFAGEAHNPPWGAKLIATTVMLAAMVVGLLLGVYIRMRQKGDAQ